MSSDKAEREKQFFARVQAQKEAEKRAKEQRMAALPPEERERLENEEREAKEHEANKSRMLKKQMGSYGSSRKIGAKGGRGRGRGRGRGKR